MYSSEVDVIVYADLFMCKLVHVASLIKVATNLEYSGISLNMRNSGNSVQPQGKIVTYKVLLVRLSNICVKHLLTG